MNFICLRMKIFVFISYGWKFDLWSGRRTNLSNHRNADWETAIALIVVTVKMHNRFKIKRCTSNCYIHRHIVKYIRYVRTPNTKRQLEHLGTTSCKYGMRGRSVQSKDRLWNMMITLLIDECSAQLPHWITVYSVLMNMLVCSDHVGRNRHQ